jgi:putative DNA primase/helicase
MQHSDTTPKKGRKKIEPKFDKTITPKEFKDHLTELTNTRSRGSTAGIFQELLDSIEPIDLLNRAFPDREQCLQRIAQIETEVNNRSGQVGPPSESSVEEPDRSAKLADELKRLKARLSRMKMGQRETLITCVEHLQDLMQQNQLGLCRHNDSIYLYTGEYWHPIDSEEFKKFLGEVAEKVGVNHFQARYHKFRDELFKQFNATEYRPAPEPDKKTVCINLQNGTYRVTEGKGQLTSFNPDDFITHQLPFRFDPKAKAPQWKKFLDEVVPEQDKQKVLAEYLGYLFVRNGLGIMKHELVLVLFGTGANGKSVFFDVITELLGSENVSNYSLENLTDKNGYYRASIADKLLNYTSEMSTSMESHVFKQLVSGEPIEARNPHGRPLNLKHYAKLILNCNEMPRIVEHTDAYFRRWLIILFDKKIPLSERDTELAKKIIASELSGVFNWILVGLQRLIDQKGFTPCPSSQVALEEFRLYSDSVRMFLNETGRRSSTSTHDTLEALYTAYRQFCLDDCFRPLGKANFRKRLEGAGIETKRRNEGWVVFIEQSGLTVCED